MFSFAQESTRYCNYAKDKFGNECTFIIPVWLELEEGSYVYNMGPDTYTSETGKCYSDLESTYFWLTSICSSNLMYNELLKQGWIAQQARAILPNSLKTELVMTGTVEQWEGFFKLRDAKDTHPQARELAEPLHAWFRKKGWVE